MSEEGREKEREKRIERMEEGTKERALEVDIQDHPRSRDIKAALTRR